MSELKASRIICAISALVILGVVGGIEKVLLPLLSRKENRKGENNV